MGPQVSADGCDYGKETRVKLAKMTGMIGAVVGFLGLIIGAGALIMALTRDTLSADIGRLERDLKAANSVYHVPESEHLRVSAMTEANAKEWADIRARMAAQQAVLDDVRSSVARIEARIARP